VSTAAGFVLLDKPVGPTSHDMVDVVRRALGIRRVGHAGTLDPPATGLLVVAVGAATRFLRYVQELPKTYRASARLGVRTSTLDATGEVLEVRTVGAGPQDVRRVAAGFVGEIEQVPPAVSALKVGGRRAHELARRGEEVVLEPRRVRVHELEVSDVGAETFDIVVRCSSGTYIRSLVADIGEALGCGAHVTMLRRTTIGHLDVDAATSPEAVGAGDVRGLEEILSHLPVVELDGDRARAARNGRAVVAETSEGLVLLVDPDGPIGVFRHDGAVLRAATVLGSG
jgi:tRNA pseudouridine55 synthase